MKRIFIIAVLSVLFVTIAAAQNLTDTIYYNKSWKMVDDAAEASFYRLYNANDKSDGRKPYQDYYIDGTLQGDGYYVWRDGEMLDDGEQRNYYKSGKIQTKWFQTNDEINGERIEYYENGNIKESEFYVNDIPEGVQKQFDSTGTIKNAYNYKNGRLDGKQVQYLGGEVDLEDYFDNGVMQKEIRYSDGKIRRIFALVSRDDTTFVANDTWYYREDEDSLISKKSAEKIYNFDPSIWGYAFQMFYVDQADFSYVDGEYGYGAISELHGKFQTFDHQGRIVKDGQYSHGEKVGKWKNYDYNQNCYYVEDFDEDVVTRYYTLDSKPLTGMYTEKRSDGAKIFLNIKNGIRCGKYTVYHYDDDGEVVGKYYGNFDDNGKEDGYFYAEMFIDGEWKTVDFSNYKHGVKHGEWREIQGDSIIFKNYNNGELDGEFQIRIANSKKDFAKAKDSLWHCVTDGAYLNGKPTGHWWTVTDRRLEQNAQEGNYVNGRSEGEWIYYGPYSSDGYVIERQIEAIINYHNGNKEGKAVTFKNKSNAPFKDSIDIVAYFKNDELDGAYEKHDNDGNIVVKGNYSNGNRIGVWTFTYPDEKAYRTRNFDDDNIPELFYTLDGKPFTGKHTETYEKDDYYAYDTVVVTVKKSLTQQVDFIDSATGKVIDTQKYKDGLPIK